jgi:uncharacterized protein (TIGR03435 family)
MTARMFPIRSIVLAVATLGGSPAFAQGASAAATTAPATVCPDASLAAYDVVSVKPVHPERILFMGAQELPDGINGEIVTVAMLVQGAYSTAVNLTLDDAVAGLPDWAKADYFSVQAKMNPDQVAAFPKLSKTEQRACRQAMMQALLGDRFKLQVHRETRQVLAYDLVVAKGGPKMKEGEPDAGGLRLSNGKLIPMRMFISNGTENVTAQAFPMDQLANLLTRVREVGHTVTDKTGLTGKYSFTLSFAASPGVGPASAGAPTDATAPEPAPSIFTALEDQLGLKLKRGTETVDTVAVDHVERPGAN